MTAHARSVVALTAESQNPEKSPTAIHLADAKPPAELISPDVLNCTDPRTFGFPVIGQIQAVANTHALKGITNPNRIFALLGRFGDRKHQFISGRLRLGIDTMR